MESPYARPRDANGSAGELHPAHGAVEPARSSAGGSGSGRPPLMNGISPQNSCSRSCWR